MVKSDFKAKFMSRLTERLAERNHGGFSLIDVVVTVAIIVALSVGGFVSYTGLVDNAKQAAVKDAASRVYMASLVSESDSNPATNSGSVKDGYEKSNSAIRLVVSGSGSTLSVTAINVDTPSIRATRSSDGSVLPATVPGPVTVARENLAIRSLGTAAVSSAGYVAINSSTVAFDAATKGIRMATTASATRDSGVNLAGAVAYTPGVATYTVAMDVAGVRDGNWSILVQGGWVNSSRSETFSIASGESRRISFTFSTLSGGAKGALYLLRNDLSVSSEVIVTNVSFERGTTGTFFDGSTPDQVIDGVAYEYSWTGAENASTSVATYRPDISTG